MKESKIVKAGRLRRQAVRLDEKIPTVSSIQAAELVLEAKSLREEARRLEKENKLERDRRIEQERRKKFLKRERKRTEDLIKSTNEILQILNNTPVPKVARIFPARKKSGKSFFSMFTSSKQNYDENFESLDDDFDDDYSDYSGDSDDGDSGDD